MSTQIFINPNQCKPEFTKIAAHSFFTSPSVSIGQPDNILYYGGNYGETKQATWSWPFYNYTNSVLAPQVNILDKTAGIPIPINLVSDDIITFSGTAFFNNTGLYIEEGYDVTLKVGVFYFDCTYNQGLETPSFTFIPVESFSVEPKGQVCFETSVTLGSNFDIHETRLLVGFVVDVSCPDETCLTPTPETQDLVTVSYTLDIERPCAVITSESNFIIRNCCEPVITELVNIPGLTVGSFHVDDEGNCWEVISASNDVTNFTRNFTDIYTSCVECQAANPCPLNLIIQSCCVPGLERVSGSLPGLVVGDTFVDNNGLCWGVSEETGAPISEESITVDTIIPGGCIDCTLANPCPSFWKVKSCCGKLSEIIATTTILNTGDSFVDTNGICWNVDSPANSLPTNYNIVVDTVYPGPIGACDQCKIANPCPTEYFITVRACCDPDRVEVVSVPSQYMSFYEGIIFNDQSNLCWEVMSYSTTGVETYSINWSSFFAGTYGTCKDCTTRFCKEGDPCPCLTLWEVQLCGTSTTYIAQANGVLDVGSIYQGQNLMSAVTECFEVLGYGYPAGGPIEVYINPAQVSYATCEECTNPVEPTFRLVTRCDTGQTINVYITGNAPAPGAIVELDLVNTFNPMLSGTYCVTMGGAGMPQPPLWTCTISGPLVQYVSCEACLGTPVEYIELTRCCTGDTIIAEIVGGMAISAGSLSAFTLYNSVDPGQDGTYCCTAGSYVIPPTPPVWTIGNTVFLSYPDCSSCNIDSGLPPCV